MNRVAHSRFALLACGLLLVLGSVPCVLGGLIWRSWQQEQLNQTLIVAIKARDTAAVIAALHNGADPNARERIEEVPLWRRFQARLRGKQTSERQGQSALYLAVGPTNIEENAPCFDWLPKEDKLIHALLEAGANPNLATNAVTPFVRASRFNETATMRTLLHSGADINSKDTEGQTALSNAVVNRRTETAQFLLKEHADPDTQDKDGITPLMAVAEYADVHPETAVRMARLLLRWQADPKRRDAQGRQALDYVEDAEKAADFTKVLQHAEATK